MSFRSGTRRALGFHPGHCPPPGGSWPAAARGCDAGQGDELQGRNHHTRWVLLATHLA